MDEILTGALDLLQVPEELRAGFSAYDFGHRYRFVLPNGERFELDPESQVLDEGGCIVTLANEVARQPFGATFAFAHSFAGCSCGHGTVVTPASLALAPNTIDGVHQWVNVPCQPDCDSVNFHGHVHVHCPKCMITADEGTCCKPREYALGPDAV